MEPNKKKIVDLGILETDEVSGVKKISLVEEPAIMLDFQYFNTQKVEKFVNPSAGESEEEFISRCIPLVMGEGKDPDQAAAICYSYWENKEFEKTEKFESFNDYPESAKNAAKRALEWRDSHPDQDCGTAVGWQRANQLSKGENISEETIARMASFARHLQYKDVPYSEGCGGLMVDAWGGEAGIEWASNKLKEIRGEDFDIDVTALPEYVDEVPEKEKPVEIVNWSKDEYTVETIIAIAKELGVKEENLKSLFKQKFASANPNGISNGDIPAAVLSDNKNELRLYKYEGNISSNSRSFCEQMVGLDLYYTEEAIKAMSDVAYNPGFGPRGADTYSIWDFKGGAQCKHFWAKFNVYMKANGDIRVQRVGPVSGKAGRKPDDMRNHGYLEARHSASFNFASEEQQILVGPAMIPDMNILRVDENGQRYYVKFSPETIKEIALKYFKEGRVHELNTDHAENSAGAYIFESWLVETKDDKANTLYGYNVPVGTWMISVKVDDAETWARVKAGELKGFSIEGVLVDMEELEAMKTYERIKKILDK